MARSTRPLGDRPREFLLIAASGELDQDTLKSNHYSIVKNSTMYLSILLGINVISRLL